MLARLPTKKTRRVLILSCIVLVSIGSIWANRKFDLVARLDNISSNPNPLIRHFAPTWRSIKKIVDIPYIIRGALTQNTLPVYDIKLSKNDRFNLINNLPNYPEENRLYEEFKKTVKGTFRFGDYKTDDAKIRYRGVSPNHWNALKKSWQINVPKDSPVGDLTTLRFFIGEDKGWVKAFLWNHIANKLGIMHLKAEPAWLRVNNEEMGEYVMMEGWDEQFLERNGKQLSPIFTNQSIPATKDFFLPESAPQWHNRFEESTSAETHPELIYFLSLVANGPDAVFVKEIGNILDVEKFLRWTLLVILSGDFHQIGNEANTNFYFNNATGKLEPVVFDETLERLSDPVDVSPNRLISRMLQQKEFMARFEEIARSYLANETNLADDLALYDEMTKRVLPAIYRDTTKIRTSYEAREQITAERNTYRNNFLTLASMLNSGGVRLNFAKESYPLSKQPAPAQKFESFSAQSASRAEFIARNPQFVAGQDAVTIILFPGAYTFSRNVIIPKGLSVVIREGVTIFMAPEVSIISYSTVRAVGTIAQPITIRPLFADKPWGVLALINAPNANEFNFVKISGGKDATINGVYFSGILSAHNSNIFFANGRIEKAQADDGIHALASKVVVENSTFNNNIADSIDLDFAENNSRITNNRFSTFQKEDLNGDAIDLSFSSLPVTKNTVESCSDKGISIGEASMPNIEDNTIKHCTYGIAVKDRSKATIARNTFEENKTAIGLYRKKPHFIDGGTAILIDNVFTNNGANTSADKYSRIEYANF